MPIAELRSRQNALPELLREVNALLPILSAVPDGVVASRESGAEMVSLAQSVMKMEPLDATADPAGFNVLLAQAKSLAGSVLSQADTSDRDTLPLPLDEASSRALADAQLTKHHRGRSPTRSGTDRRSLWSGPRLLGRTAPARCGSTRKRKCHARFSSFKRRKASTAST
jgi:hypothetical protein